MDSVRGLVGALIAIRDAELFADGIDADLPRKATRAEVFALGRESVFDELVSHGIDIAALAQQPAGEAVAWGVLLNGRLQYAVRSREACESEASVYGSGVTVEIVPLYLHTPADSAPLVDREMVKRAMNAEYNGTSMRDALQSGTDWNYEVLEAALKAAMGVRNG